MKWLKEVSTMVCGNCDKEIPTGTKKGMNYCPYCDNEVYYNDNSILISDTDPREEEVEK